MWTLLLNLLFCQVLNGEDTKVWTTNVNFENPRNWPDGKLPCPNDRIIFPQQANLVTFLPLDFSFSEMVLPINGELLFRDGSNLWLKNKKSDESCQGTDVEFIVNTDYWYDPQNWNVSSTRLHPNRGVPYKNLAVPHALQIPCETNHVIFSKNTAFKAHVEGPIKIGSLEINGVVYNNEEFQGLLYSRTGKLLFPNTPRMTVSGFECNIPSGCKCSTDDSQVIMKVCKHVTCPQLECSDPVKPSGFCCPICAAFLEMEYNIGFDIEKFSDFLKILLTKSDFKEIQSFTFKTYEDKVQSVFVDSGQKKGGAAEISKTIKEKLTEDLEESNVNKIHSINIYLSQNWAANVPTQYLYGNHGISGGGIFGIVFVLLCLSGIAVAWYIYRKRHIPGFNFARFDLRSNKIELELGTTPHEELDPETDSVESFPPSKELEETAAISKSFDNPIYDVVSESSEKTTTEQDKELSEDVVENPMFMMFDKPS